MRAAIGLDVGRGHPDNPCLVYGGMSSTSPSRSSARESGEKRKRQSSQRFSLNRRPTTNRDDASSDSGRVRGPVLDSVQWWNTERYPAVEEAFGGGQGGRVCEYVRHSGVGGRGSGQPLAGCLDDLALTAELGVWGGEPDEVAQHQKGWRGNDPGVDIRGEKKYGRLVDLGSRHVSAIPGVWA